MTDQFNNGIEGGAQPELTKPQLTKPEITNAEDLKDSANDSANDMGGAPDTGAAPYTPGPAPQAVPQANPAPGVQSAPQGGPAPYAPGPAPQANPAPGVQSAPQGGPVPYAPGPAPQAAPRVNPARPAQAPQPPHQPPYGWAPQNGPWGGQAPYYAPPYAAPKPSMSTALKVFIFIISFLAVGAVAGFIAFTAYTGFTNRTTSYRQPYDSSSLEEFLEEYEKQYGGKYGDYDDYGDYGGKEQEPGNGLPPTTDEPKTDNPIVQPDIEVTPFNGTGITIKGKPSGAELSAQQVYEKVVPSTVGIVATILLSNGSTTQSGGTGMFISSDGYILTNSHVVGNTKTSGVTITTHDGTEYPAVIVSFDKTTDLAVLKTEDHNFTPVEFGSAEDLSIGEWVMAIGNPGGATFSGSLTRGVISGLDREVGDYSSNGMTYIQTDAAINPGNSGGPLVNMYGQVVGINSSKIIAQYYEGMGFAIPVSGAKSIIDQLLTSGYVRGRTRLGITGQNMVYEYPSGVRIVNIDSESSFTGTEARVNDIITAVDGTEISGLTDLANLLLDHSPGDKVEITLYRPDTEETLTVTATLLEDKGETQR